MATSEAVIPSDRRPTEWEISRCEPPLPPPPTQERKGDDDNNDQPYDDGMVPLKTLCAPRKKIHQP